MTESPTAPRGRLAALAITTAIAVSVIYLPQPLLTQLVRALHTTTSGASAIATTVQLGYAAGIFLLVPLADRLQPRRQVTVQLLLLAAALAVTAALPGVGSVAVGFLAVGLVANVPQLIIPVASRLAPADRKHATTSMLVGALLVGIFGGRIAASALASLLGWRAVLVVFAVLVLGTIPLVRHALPARMDLPHRHSYGRLLLGTARRAVRSRPLVQSAVMQFCGFAAFNAVWTVMVLHLTGPAYGWTVPEAGLFGLVGLAAGLVTPLAGRWMERFGHPRVTAVFLALAVLAMASIVLDSGSVWFFGASVFFLTWANQILQAGNQARALTSNPDGAAQANTVFMVAVFLGGALGGALGPVVFSTSGMPGVAVLGLVLFAGFVLAWTWSVLWERAQRRGDLRGGTQSTPTRRPRPASPGAR